MALSACMKEQNLSGRQAVEPGPSNRVVAGDAHSIRAAASRVVIACASR